ncbi:phytoene/squalene synthase family protein [Stappia sp. ICDLI1TA098]
MTAPTLTAGEHCLALVRQFDFDRYISLLHVPEPKRSALAALYAFNMEIARAREIVSDPMPGEIRFQWWRDALAAEPGGDADQHPVAGAIRAAIATYNLPLGAFLDLIEARTFDLYDDPMPTIGDLEGYAGETSSALIQLAAIVLADGRDPGTSEAAGHAGVAYALAGLVRALPWHAARRQLYLPADLLARHEVEPEDIFSGKATPQLRTAISELCDRAQGHLLQTRARIASVPRGVVPAFLPASLVEPALRRVEKAGFDPFGMTGDISRLRKLWYVWQAVRLARKHAPSD